MSNAALKISGLIIFLAISAIGIAQKNDKVFLKNGDVITGEIKSLKFAKLSFDMSGPGTIDIKWEFIIKINSDKTFQVTLQKGEILITKLDSLFFNSKQITLNDIVEIVQIKDRFLERLDGDINLGFNYAKSNSNLQFNFKSTITYRKPKEETTFKLNSVITSNSSDTLNSKKQDATLDYFRKLKNSFYLNGLFAWQQNTELGLQSRFQVNIGGGKILISNNHRRFLTGLGLSYNEEQSTGNSIYKGNLEGVIGIEFKEFRYSTPKVSIDSKLLLYPGLSDWGRFRMDLHVSSKVEIFKDFNVGLSLYDIYDNRPPAGASSKNDFGVNFTVGYEFGK
jgi:hypothetical protein